MANALFLLQPNFTFNPSFRFPPLRSFPIHNNAFKFNYSSCKVIIGENPKLRVKCFSMSPKPKGENDIGGSTFPETTSPTTPKSSEKPLEGDELGSSVSVEAAVAVEPAIGVNPLIAGSMTVFALGLMTKILSSILLGKKTSVAKLQVGLSRRVKSLQTDLTRMAETADSSTPQGLTNKLKETIQVLLSYTYRERVSGYSSGDAKRSMLEVEKVYNQLSFEERSKFDEETRVNNIRENSGTTYKGYNINHYIVITIIVAAEGVHKLPPIKTDENLTKALQKLWNIPSSSVKAVDVFWTPQNGNDILLEKEFREDYPLLHSLIRDY